MTRPSTNTDQKLIDAGKASIIKQGLSGLSVRGVAAEAGVNLGMFHYHFKSKEKFGEVLLSGLYEDFFKHFEVEANREGSSLDRLKRALFALGVFTRDNRELIMALVQDVLQGYQPTLQFVNKNVIRHASIIQALVDDCQKKGHLKKMPLPMAMSFLASSVAFPNLMVVIMSRAKAKAPFGRSLKEVSTLMLSDAAIRARIDLAIGGLSC